MTKAEESWIAHIRLGSDGFTLAKTKDERNPSTLAAKQALVFHLLDRFVGPLTGKRIKDGLLRSNI